MSEKVNKDKVIEEVVQSEIEPSTANEELDSKKDLSIKNESTEEKASRLPTAADLLADDIVEPVKRKKGSKNISVGIAFVKTTFNNTIVSITDMRGNVISWSNCGAL